MDPHVRTRVLSAVVGGLGVVGLGITGMSLGEQTPDPVTVVAPATGVMAVQDEPGEVTTTTSAGASFRPVVTATVPPPPTD